MYYLAATGQSINLLSSPPIRPSVHPIGPLSLHQQQQQPGPPHSRPLYHAIDQLFCNCVCRRCAPADQSSPTPTPSTSRSAQTVHSLRQRHLSNQLTIYTSAVATAAHPRRFINSLHLTHCTHATDVASTNNGRGTLSRYPLIIRL